VTAQQQTTDRPSERYLQPGELMKLKL